VECSPEKMFENVRLLSDDEGIDSSVEDKKMFVKM
jgi:hypothetical protein